MGGRGRGGGGGYIRRAGGSGYVLYLYIADGRKTLPAPPERGGRSPLQNTNCAMTKDCSVYICVCSITANCVVVMGGVAVGGG